jgi:hypothetical protein
MIASRGVAASATTTLRVLYGLGVPGTQETGNYTGDITYSATVSP